MAIDKSIRQYQQLVQPGTGRPGYAGPIDRNIANLKQKKELFPDEWTKENEAELQRQIKAKGGIRDKLLSGDPVKNGGGGKEKNILEKLAAPFFKGQETISPKADKTELVSAQRPNVLKTIMNQLAQGYLGKRTMGLGVPAIRSVKKAIRGEPFDFTGALKRGYTSAKADPLKFATKGYRALDLGKNILGGAGKGIMSAAPLLGAGAGIAYLHRNRERFTGYPTQIAYEQARQERINIDRIDMRSDPKTLENLKIIWKRQGFNDDEIRDKTNQFKGDTTKMKADIVGADIFNPNEMKNLDENFENIKYNIDPSDVDPSWTGEDYEVIKAPTDIVQFPGENEIIQQQREAEQIEQRNRLAEQREQERLQREVTLEAERKAQRLREEQAAISLPPTAPSSEQERGGGGRDYGHQETRSSSGWQSSPFKKGGRVDKALGGRSRDI